MVSIRLVVVPASEANKPRPLTDEEQARLKEHGTIFSPMYYSATAGNLLKEVYESLKPWKISADDGVYWLEWADGTFYGRYYLRKYRAPWHTARRISWVEARDFLMYHAVGMPKSMREV